MGQAIHPGKADEESPSPTQILHGQHLLPTNDTLRLDQHLDCPMWGDVDASDGERAQCFSLRGRAPAPGRQEGRHELSDYSCAGHRSNIRW